MGQEKGLTLLAPPLLVFVQIAMWQRNHQQPEYPRLYKYTHRILLCCWSSCESHCVYNRQQTAESSNERNLKLSCFTF